MTAQQLEAFLKTHKMSTASFADLIGLTPSAVKHWLDGRRTIAKPYSRLVRMFEKRPELMQEFAK